MVKIEVDNIFLEYHIQDCLEGMKEMSKNYIDLVVTSPPYDNMRSYGGFSFNLKGIVKELFRVIKKGGVVVWVVGDETVKGSETGTSFRQALNFMKIGFNLHDTMIYEKNGPTHPSSNRYHQVFEYMFVFSKGKPKTINLLKDRKNIWDKAWGKRSIRNKNGERVVELKRKPYEEYGYRFNIWRYHTGYGFGSDEDIAYEHPAIFPDKLAKDHILSWSNKFDLILDPFLGSGTVLKQCRLLERNGIGFEINPDYEHIIQERIKANIKGIESYFEE